MRDYAKHSNKTPNERDWERGEANAIRGLLLIGIAAIFARNTRKCSGFAINANSLFNYLVKSFRVISMIAGISGNYLTMIIMMSG